MEAEQRLIELQVFGAKVAIVTIAVFAVIFASLYTAKTYIESQLEVLQGGPAFWAQVEEKLYKFADAKDLPPEKKARIVAALTKISERYKPYFDAVK